MPEADTPVLAAEYFWDDVRELLTAPGGSYRHTPQRAAQGIETYKQDVLRRRGLPEIPDAVYNQGEEHTAAIIDGVIRQGLPGPR